MATNNNNLLWRPLQTSYASCTSLQMRESVELHWFDYGMQQHAPSSVLSSLYEGANPNGMSMYDEMLVSKDFEDEDLAEIDIESFRHEDMNLLLNKGARRGSSSLVTSSIYRPERLFSPLPDNMQLRLSQDSLDMSGYPGEENILKTCKANKNNYTIAFEGSIICSEASFYGGGDFVDGLSLDQRKRDLLEDLERRKAPPLKMSASADYNLTTWSKLKKTHNSSNLNRFLAAPQPPIRKFQCWAEKRSSMGSSGNVANLQLVVGDACQPSNWPLSALRRTKSLSSLGVAQVAVQKIVEPSPTPSHTVRRPKLNVSQVIMDNMDQESSAGSPSYEQNKLRSLLPNCAIPIHHSQHLATPEIVGEQKNDDSSSAATTTTTSNNNNVAAPGADRQPSFNLVKLFIKQKSSSTDTCMDVSSGCWPSDSPSMSFEQQQQQQLNQVATVNANIQNRNYFKKRLDRHEEENDVDSLDPLVNNNNVVDGAQKGELQQKDQQHTVMENNNNMINNLINNNHCLTESSESITQIYNNIRNNNGGAGNAAAPAVPKNTNLRRMQMQETVTRSMQTSIPKLITSATQYASKAADAVVAGRAANLDQRVKIVPSSFLSKLHTSERRGEGGIAPVYVIYPNYTLPNLDFVTKHDVILSPIDYKDTFLGMSGGKLGAISKVKSKEATMTSPQSANSAVGGRPKSFSDILSGKQRAKFDYKNICDWRSLIVLLPMEYSRILRSIPDIEKELEGMHEEIDDGFGEESLEQHNTTSGGESMSTSQRQLFCQTTPVMRRRSTRPLSCDCAAYIMQNSSSSSSSNQPASSGYRGSSTILTDSEFGVLGIDGELSSEDASGLPPTHCGRTPKGILRRNFNRTKMRVQQVKRNSLYDGAGGEKVVDKRRSLQEFPTQQYFDNMPVTEGTGVASPGLSPLLNYKQQGSGSGNDLSGLGRFRSKLSSELEALELELYEEAARIEEDPHNKMDTYDRLKLRNDVSRALSNHPKRVSFTGSGNSKGDDSTATLVQGNTTPQAERPTTGANLNVPVDFTTPPNSPNVSVMAQKNKLAKEKQSEQERIQSNRFKRLQIQWELMSKDSESLLEELKEIIPLKKETKSGGSTPTGPQRISRIPIPRPISYPAVGSRIPEPKAPRTPLGKTAGNTKKVSSPTTGLTRVNSAKTAAVGAGQAAKRATSNVTTNRFVPKAR